MAEDFGLPTFGVGVVAVHFVRSRANSAASSPPVPARISMMSRERFASSPPTVSSNSSLHNALALGAQLRQLGLGQLAHLGIVAVDHLLGFGDLPGDLLELAILLGELAERAVLASDGRDARRIGQHLGIDEVIFELLEAGQFLIE